MAMSLIEALYKRGFRIPEDIAVAGFDNLEIGRNVTPSLSTVTFPIYEMGQTAMNLLPDSFKGNPLPGTPSSPPSPYTVPPAAVQKRKTRSPTSMRTA